MFTRLSQLTYSVNEFTVENLILKPTIINRLNYEIGEIVINNSYDISLIKFTDMRVIIADRTRHIKSMWEQLDSYNEKLLQTKKFYSKRNTRKYKNRKHDKKSALFDAKEIINIFEANILQYFDYCESTFAECYDSFNFVYRRIEDEEAKRIW